ncbi:MAG: hypothetical protein HYV60_13785 [Planctomycetia bacterium]|nr:hypothetical protein [Planctomycetia bacterium]
MNIVRTNPCAACTIDQDCCKHLSGLRLTQVEFDRCFKQHAGEIAVEREGPLWVVSQRDGGACPNWQEGGCAVYDERPRECALFPYTLHVQQRGDAISVRVHSDTRCPLKAQLLGSEKAAEQLAQAFAQEAFGEHARIRVGHETKWQSLRRRLRSLVSRTLDTLLS